MSIVAKNLTKRFGTFQAVGDVSFEVPAGQLVALLGPSGSGKSTILRIIAGLEAADAGLVELTGEDATHLPVQARGVGFVFQHYALFRHMTVRQNVAFGLEVQRLPRGEIRDRVDELLELVQMTGHRDRYPSQLSGGQRQRVALARALAPRPKVLLLDEPFGALDARVRQELRIWLRRLHDEVHVTSLFVTHDQEEAFEVADQVIVMNRGRVEQMGPPQELYEQPSTAFVTGFLGSVNVLRVHGGFGATNIGDGSQPASQTKGDDDAAVSLYIRPHDLELTHERNGHPAWPGRVTRVAPLGAIRAPRCHADRRDRRAGGSEPRALCGARDASRRRAGFRRSQRLQGVRRSGRASVSFSRDDSRGDPHRGDQAGWIGETFPSDIKRRSVRDARSDDRQPERDIDGPVEAGGLERDVPLVVIHGHDGVVGARQRVIKQGIIGKRPRDVDTLAAAELDRRADRGLLFVAEQAVFAGMRVKGGHGDSWGRAAGQRPHRPVGQADLGEDGFSRHQLEHAFESDVQGHVDDPQPSRVPGRRGRGATRGRAVVLEIKHHRVIGHAAEFGEDFGVPRVVHATLTKGKLIEG